MIPFLPEIPGTSNRTAIISLAFIVALLLTAIGCYLGGHHRGYAEAEAIGAAKYNKMVAEYQGAKAESLAKALDRAAQLTEQGNRISAQLITTRAELTDARAQLSRRIPDATAALPASCVFGPEFVHLWNDLLGLPATGAAQAADPGGAAVRVPSAAGPGAGVQPGEPVATPADLLAHLRDYGQYCRESVAMSASRRKLLEAWAQ